MNVNLLNSAAKILTVVSSSSSLSSEELRTAEDHTAQYTVHTLSIQVKSQRFPFLVAASFLSSMALPFSSPSTLRTVCSKPTPLLSIRDACCRMSNGLVSSNVRSWKSSGNYVAVQVSVRSITRNFSSVEQLRGMRRATVRCATIEEIEAQKSKVEKDVKDRMQKAIESLLSNFNSIRTGRANPSMLDRVEVEYYGTPVSLKSIAQISTPDSNSFLVQPYDKSSLKLIEKAIVSSDVGLTPSNDGEVIRLIMPQLTSDRRKELSKVVAKQAEEGKVALRNIRRDGLKAYEKLEKEKKLSEDNVKDFSSDLQKVTDEYMKKVESLYKQKEKELLTV